MAPGFSVLQQGRRPVAAALAVILIGALLFSAVAWRYHRVLVSEAQDRTTRMSFLLSEQATRTFEAVDFTLRGFEPLIASDSAGGSPELVDLLRRRASELSFVQSLRIVDPEGRVVAASDLATAGLVSDPGCLAALAPAEAAPIAIGCTAGDRGADGRAAIAVARRLTDAQGRFRGVIVADLEPGYFSRFFAGLDLGRNALVTLTESHGHLLLASTHPPDSGDEGHPTLVPPTERTRLGELERASRSQITAVHATDGYPLSVLVGIDRSEVERRWWQVVAPTLALTLCAGALLFALAFNLERHRAERARALRRAAVAEKLEAMGQMTASVAHDFRNVLAALHGSLRLLRKRGPDPAVLTEAAATLERGNAMVDRLLAMSRRQELRLETHDVNALIADLATTLRHVAGLDATVTIDLAPGLPPCRLDRVQFDAALMNLVVNARQAMLSGGAVTVLSRLASASASHVEVAVRDTGCGIDPATLKRVFEPFFTTKERTGTGLGLAQVQGFMAEIGGRVAIASAVGVGTTVSLHLPAAPTVEAEPGVRHRELVASDPA